MPRDVETVRVAREGEHAPDVSADVPCRCRACEVAEARVTTGEAQVTRLHVAPHGLSEEELLDA